MDFLENYIAFWKQLETIPLPGRSAQLKMFASVRQMPPVVPADARESAVNIMVYPFESRHYFTLIKRTEDGKAHSGQISLPGGRKETEDRNLLITAQRETEEELGISGEGLYFIKALTPLYIPVSNSHVFPFLTVAHSRPDFRPSDKEVARVLEVPVNSLLEPARKIRREVSSPADPAFRREVNAYQLDGDQVVWGATAMILSEWESLLISSGLDFSTWNSEK